MLTNIRKEHMCKNNPKLKNLRNIFLIICHWWKPLNGNFKLNINLFLVRIRVGSRVQGKADLHKWKLILDYGWVILSMQHTLYSRESMLNSLCQILNRLTIATELLQIKKSLLYKIHSGQVQILERVF